MQTSLFRRFISILGAKITTLLLGLFITPILVRLLGSSLYGDYAFILSILGITMILANAGIFDGARKYIAEDREDSNWVEHVFGFYLRVAAQLAALAAFLFILFSWFGLSDRFFNSNFSIYFYLLAALIISRQAYSVARGGLMGLGFEDQSEPLSILKKVLFGIFGLSFAYIGYDVAGILLGHILASLITSLLAFMILFRHLNTRYVFTRVPAKFPKKSLLSFNFFSIILIFMTSSLYHVDILLLRPITGSEATGYYRAALVVAEFLWFVPNAIQMFLLHSSSELWSKNKISEITNIVSKVTRYNLLLVLLFSVGLAALANDFVTVYFGPDFSPTVRPLLLLLPGTLGFALARPIFAVGQGKGELRILILATGAAAVMNLCLNLLLIPLYGISGAAVATSISYGSMVVFHVIAARKIGFDPVSDLRLSKIVFVALTSSIVIFGISSIISSSYLSLSIVPPIGFIVYIILTVKFGVLSSEEIDDFAQRLPNPIDEHFRRFVVVLQNH
ncbi:oligosaccharide flippase family protein [Natrialba taiwanensis]|uniref:Polysaccharide biosynthesis protein n=1 Tax=Natrialba taiwanensis DSM 12281 TaxID=1230458 RepID=M0A079_9EURY|nr:polysaccharide biosynthesis C-terminal domain-containing protein [Natrialba taiwanensis]ELY90793.1 polysaccharide biosynthesis protein [Natrialba taiwanensis DSM 12281]